MQAGYKTPKFVTGAGLATILCLVTAFGPPIGVAEWLGPQSFLEHVVTAVICGITGFFSICGSVFLWVLIASRFE